MNLITALMMIDKRSEAGEMQRNFQRLVEDVRECLVEVFAEPLVSSRVSKEGVFEEVNVATTVPEVEVFSGSEFLV